ncbi:hypothetical protein N7508_008075 [Penicillium antarcticum]|uniref:uncharacterized protein n=1 Tax=Penicillium antarcticum TaxID=416450 RepID=UPI0023A33F42|nr:uncharacterized protein N7508_008075 [Penicillium antarcticum]KAJ5297826.1 hypothetical protein N7508_008075 [Penicillium antarcticum]
MRAGDDDGFPEGYEKWIKMESEVMDGQQMICVVGKDQWPDLSLGRRFTRRGSESVTEETPILREIGWVFAEEQSVECLFSVYAAKPGTTDEDVVDFKDLVIELEVLD